MADVKINVVGEDKASAELAKIDGKLDKLSKTAKSSKNNWTEFYSALRTADRVLGAAKRAFGEIIGTTVEYAKQVREMTQVTGLGADEISRIIQVGDDWGIEIGQLRVALGYMNKMGVTPSIENLADLADEYVNSADKSAFAEKAAKLLGRGYQTLIPLLAKGGSALRSQTAAVADNLIMTDKAIAQAREYEVAVDKLSEAWEGFSMTLGQKSLPLLTGVVMELGELANAKNLGETFAILKKYSGSWGGGWNDLQAGVAKYAAALKKANDLMPVFAAETKEASKASIFLDNTLRSSMMEDWERNAILGGDAARRFGQGVEKAGDKAEGAKRDIEGFWNAINTGVTSDAQRALEQLAFKAAGGMEIDAMIKKTKDAIATGAITEAEGKKFLEGLFVAGTRLEYDLGNINLWEAAQEIRDQLGIPLQEALDLVRKFKGEAKFDILSRVRIEIDYDTGIGAGFIPEGAGVPGFKPKKKKGPGGEHGLNMIVPPGYPNDSYMVGATSGESVNITPAGQSGGGDMFVELTVIGAPGQDPNQIANLAVMKIADARRAWAGGGAYTG